VFACSTDYYPPGKEKQKNSLAEFLRRLPSVRLLHVVPKVRSVQNDFKHLVLWGVMLYSLVDGCRHIGVFYCPPGSGPCAPCAHGPLPKTEHQVLKTICSNVRSSAPEDGHNDA